MKGLMVSVMANVTNTAIVANVADSSNVAAVNANNHSNKQNDNRDNTQSNKGVKITVSSTSPTVSTESSIISPPSTWPTWMQKAMMDNGRVAFRGSKIGIKIGKLHSKRCSLKKMLKIIKIYQKRLYPAMKQSDFRRRPTPSYLRRHCTCIAVYRAKEGSRADCDFSIILYDNGWFEYWGTSRRTTLYLPDCKDFIYKYNLVIDEIDKTTINQSVLENTTWYTAATLFAEERITQNMVGYGSNAPCDNSEIEAGEEQPVSESKKVTEIVGAVHIPTPEERLLKEERRNEMRRIINDTLPILSQKQTDIYHFLFDCEMSRCQVCEILQVQESTLRHRIKKLQEKFDEQIKKHTGGDAKEFFGLNSSEKGNEQNVQKRQNSQAANADVICNNEVAEEDENDFEDDVDFKDESES